MLLVYINENCHKVHGTVLKNLPLAYSVLSVAGKALKRACKVDGSKCIVERTSIKRV